MIHEPSLDENTLFGEFLIRRALGQGAYGSVYEAYWKRTGGRVALKVLHRKHLDGADAVGRFLREAEALQRLAHPDIVDVLAYGDLQGLPYIVLEYLDGVPLDERTSRRVPFAVEDALDVFLPVVGAVDAMHRIGVVHRDLKPGNIFLVRDASGGTRPKLLDFGLAKITRSGPLPGLTQPAIGMGTPNYMSPEQIRDASAATPLSDQFSLGVILYLLLTGRRPFEAHNQMDVIHRVLGADFVPPALVVPSIPPPVAEAITRAMRAKPEERHPSLRELAQELLPFASVAMQESMTATFTEPTEGVQTEAQASSRASRKCAIEPFRSVLDARRLRDREGRRQERRFAYAWAGLSTCALASVTTALLLGTNASARANPPSPPLVTTEGTLRRMPPGGERPQPVAAPDASPSMAAPVEVAPVEAAQLATPLPTRPLPAQRPRPANAGAPARPAGSSAGASPPSAPPAVRPTTRPRPVRPPPVRTDPDGHPFF